MCRRTVRSLASFCLLSPIGNTPPLLAHRSSPFLSHLQYPYGRTSPNPVVAVTTANNGTAQLYSSLWYCAYPLIMDGGHPPHSPPQQQHRRPPQIKARMKSTPPLKPSFTLSLTQGHELRAFCATPKTKNIRALFVTERYYQNANSSRHQ